MLPLITVHQTKNPCYKKGQAAKQIGILVHSTGANNKYVKRYVDAPEYLGQNQYNNHWNKSDANKCMHAFVGLDINKEPIIAETLPYEFACWGCGTGKKGSYNRNPTAHIQFEICQGSDTDAEYYWRIIKTAEDYCVYLCRKFGFTADNITSHVEAYKAGYASNHGDPNSWMKNFGDNMNKFRERVAAALLRPEEENAKPEEEKKPTMKYNYKVTGTRLAFRSEPRATDATLIDRIETNTVITGNDPENGWVLCEYKGRNGYCMEKYLKNMGPIVVEDEEEDNELTDEEKIDILWSWYMKDNK